MYSIHGISFNKLGLKINWLDNPITKDDPRNILGGIPCALMLNHLQSIRDFLATPNEYGIICEDDFHLRKTFVDDIHIAIDGFKRLKLDVLLLGYLINYHPFEVKLSSYHRALETNCG